MTQSEYFEIHREKPKFFIGDKVKTTLNGVTLHGTVLNDSVTNISVGPMVSIYLDKQHEGRNVILVEQKIVKLSKKIIGD